MKIEDYLINEIEHGFNERKDSLNIKDETGKISEYLLNKLLSHDKINILGGVYVLGLAIVIASPKVKYENFEIVLINETAKNIDRKLTIIIESEIT